MSNINVATLGESERAQWERFIEESSNATLFHDLRFLAYHPAGRFDFRHLLVRNDDAIVAVLPGGVVETDRKLLYASPLGASVGGPAFGEAPPLQLALDVVGALQRYAEDQSLSELRFTLAPRIYEKDPSDTLAFALHRNGFTLEERQLCFVLPLRDRTIENLFHKGALQRLSAARRDGLTVKVGGVELLPSFEPVFDETYQRHGASATHTLDEIRYILEVLPERAFLTVVLDGELPVAALLVFAAGRNAATTFYTCSTRASNKGSRGLILAFEASIAFLKTRGLEYLDLGPSASTSTMNEGVVVFKEGLGALGQARDTWMWRP